MVIHMKKIFFVFLTSIVFIFLIYFYNQPSIRFVDKIIQIPLNSEVEPYEYIEKVSHMNIKEIKVVNHVDNKKLGQYQIEYHYQDKEFILKVDVIDVLPPTFETINTKILRNETVDPQTLVKNICDDSQTIVYFKKDYLFNEVKTYRVDIVVEDAYENKTEKHAYVLVEEKDTQPPTLTGLDKITALLGDAVNLESGVTIKDDHDNHPQLTIDDSKLNLSTEGEYEVFYFVEDKYGNKASYSRKVEILNKYANREAKKDGIKTCYLTFDDGPSSNTQKVLQILDEYHIKATFFVTGTSPKDFHYIKEAHEKGHVIGLHTYSHDYEYIYSSLKNYLEDLNKIKELVYQQTGQYVTYMRFPGGSSNLVSKKYNVGIMRRLTKRVIDLGYKYYDWTSVNGDGEGVKSVADMKKKIKEEVEGLEDVMILMHDSASCENTVKALPDILDYLIAEGYEFKVIDHYSPTFHHTVHN